MKIIRINSGAKSGDQAKEAYRNLKSPKNHYDEKEIRFVNYTFGNIARHRQRDRIFRIIPQLEQLAAGSVPIYSEPKRNPQKHSNIKQYHNDLAKVSIDDSPYYVRLTTQEIKDSRNELHNVFVSDVEITKAGIGDDISAISNATSNFSSTSYDEELISRLKKVKEKADRTTKVVDENGDRRWFIEESMERQKTRSSLPPKSNPSSNKAHSAKPARASSTRRKNPNPARNL